MPIIKSIVKPYFYYTEKMEKFRLRIKYMKERKLINPVEPLADNGIALQYEIEKAAWIWHPDFNTIQIAFLHFVNEFEVKADTETTIHVSGDQRYELYLDGKLLSRGPDRCDKEHWSFASYDLTLSVGKHTLTAEVYWLGDKSPAAQMSSHPGFILAAEGLEELNTGKGNWRVAEQRGIYLGPNMKHFYHVIGPSFILNGSEYFADFELKKAVIIRQSSFNTTGMFLSDRNLFPTSLPEQKVEKFSKGTIRAINNSTEYPVPFLEEDEIVDSALNFLNSSIEIPANSKVNILWDLDNYYCAYNHLKVSNGAGAEIKMEWAESLYRSEANQYGQYKHKDNRNKVSGKIFYGFGDTFFPSGGDEKFRSFWWRAGRYVLISVKTTEQALTIFPPELETTRYPLSNDSDFHSSDTELDGFIPIAVRGLQMCSHETLMDCPYYEQLMYVGDSRLELLTWYAINSDNRFPKRCIELFDWSRWKTGFIAERYPSDPYQLSLTFSTIWIYMLHDFMMWRDDIEWMKKRLVGMRCLLENFRALVHEDGLLHKLPGWSFIDWVEYWELGAPKTDDTNILSVINLQFIFALQKAAEIERAVGDPIMATRNEELANKIKDKVYNLFWNEDESLLADTPSHKEYSEHAQCLALLTGTIPEPKRETCLYSMINHANIAKTTIYFSFYLMETFKMMNRGDLILKRMQQSKELVQNGLKTTIEQPEPSRSDCHAWGAHPIFHLHASLAGIRPTKSGFKKLIIKPSPGDLKFIKSTTPHPKGEIKISLQFNNGNCTGTITLPPETTAILEWKDKIIKLNEGENLV